MSHDNPLADLDHIVALLDRVTDRARSDIARRLDWPRMGALRPWHLPILLLLPPSGARPSDLAARAGISRQAVSQWIRELASDGFLEVSTAATDRRGRVVSPTKNALAAIGSATDAIREVETACAAQIGGQSLEDLRRTMIDLRHHLS